MYVREDLLSSILLQDSNSYCDSIILEIKQLDLIVVNFYRPPSCPENMFSQSLEAVKNQITSRSSKDLFISGDFNFPFLSWDSGVIDENFLAESNSEQRQAKSLIEFANEFFLHQHIDKPTRRKNILDLVFCNNHLLISDFKILFNSNLSDHFLIRIDLSYKEEKKKSRSKKSNISCTNLPKYELQNADEEDKLRINCRLGS